MFEHGVRQEFWHALALAIGLLILMFLGGWVAVFLLLMPTGTFAILGALAYPFIVILLVVLLVLSLELIVRIQIRQPIWINPPI